MQVHSVNKLQSFIILKRAVHREPLGFKGLAAPKMQEMIGDKEKFV
jgi:hypothetical protein